MEYTTVYIGAYNRPDGYNGHIALVYLVWERETMRTIEVHRHGWHYNGTALSCSPKDCRNQIEKQIAYPTRTKRFYTRAN